VKGLFLTAQSYIKSQPDPKNPSGTIISVSSGFAGRIHPGFSAYSVGKLGEQKLGEYVDAGKDSYFLLSYLDKADRMAVKNIPT
jgi:hypothetical protein